MKCRGGIEAFRPSKYEGSGGKQSRCGFNDFAGCDWLLVGTSRRNRLLVRAAPHVLASYIEQQAQHARSQTRNMHVYIAVQLRACGAEGSTARGHASIVRQRFMEKELGPTNFCGSPCFANNTQWATSPSDFRAFLFLLLLLLLLRALSDGHPAGHVPSALKLWSCGL